jgi:hypothetical protein
MRKDFQFGVILFCVMSTLTVGTAHLFQPEVVSPDILARINAAGNYDYCQSQVACGPAAACVPNTCTSFAAGCNKTGGTTGNAPVAGATIGTCGGILSSGCNTSAICGLGGVPAGCNAACSPNPCDMTKGRSGC